MSVDQKALKQEKRRVVERLEELGVGPVLGVYRKPSEAIYFLEVEVPNEETLRVLENVGPMLDKIMMNNDFMIAVLPVPPGTKATREAQTAAAVP